ncbi:hypothetical protein AB9P05_05455 [Roseivirga sp. BDSF3-8]|uniref:DUF6980 family protein n=1 Tax=Roseivirga sp. BDSF3-8 TaxID=3241598 RepID=UPI003532016E
MLKENCCKDACNHIGLINEIDNPDVLVVYNSRFDEYGIPVRDGGESYVLINFCPWCGIKFPESKRDQWFDELERLGYNSDDFDIPDKFKSNDWFLK